MKLFCDSSQHITFRFNLFTFCTRSVIYTYHSSIIPAVSRATDRESLKNMSSPSSSSSSILGTVSHIYTYPLKGANGQKLSRTTLSPFTSIPNDRSLALLRAETIRANKWMEDKSTKENADIVLQTGEGKDPQHHSNKHLFHQLITDPQLGKYECVLTEEDFSNIERKKKTTM